MTRRWRGATASRIRSSKSSDRSANASSQANCSSPEVAAPPNPTYRGGLFWRRGLRRGGEPVAIPEIIGSLRSTYTRVVCMVCEEKGIDYVLTERPLRAAELFAIHPFGRMPVLRHGEVEL